jgi:hypothetical protein
MGSSRRKRQLKLTQLPPESRDALFGVWISHPERRWLAKVWGWLEKDGLAAYTDGRGYHHVLGRLAVLAHVYHEWNRVAYASAAAEIWNVYPYWFKALPFEIRALQEEFSHVWPKDNSATSISAEQMSEVMRALIKSEVNPVFDALLRHYDPLCGLFELGHDLRHACGKGDKFDWGNTRFDETAAERKFFDENGVTFGESSAVSLMEQRCYLNVK